MNLIHAMERSQLIVRGGRTLILFFIAASIGLLLSYTEIYLTEVSTVNNFTSVRRWRPKVDDQEWNVILKFDHSNTHSLGALPFPDSSRSDLSSKNASFTEGIESNSLLNISNFKFLSTYSSLCSNYAPNEQFTNNEGNDKLFLIIIQSSRKNYKERNAVRKTWGSVQPNIGNWSVRTFFIMGVDPLNQYETPHDDPILDVELSEFGDLVIGNFLDTWKNNSYKSMAGLKWVLDYCTNADFVLITSDNIFVNVNQFIKYREQDLEQNPAPNLYCGITQFQEPIRCSDCDYFVDINSFPFSVYPDYCSGIAYGMTVDLIRKLYSVSNQVRFLWISDVFITGILMEAAKTEFSNEMQVVQRELWENDITVNVREGDLVMYCSEYGEAESTEHFKTLVSVPKVKAFEEYMICLLNKTLNQ